MSDRTPFHEQVRAALARLTRREASLLVLRYGGASYREIAETLDVAPTSVGTMLRRAEAAFARLTAAHAAYQGMLARFGLYTGSAQERESAMKEAMEARASGDAARLAAAEKALLDAHGRVASLYDVGVQTKTLVADHQRARQGPLERPHRRRSRHGLQRHARNACSAQLGNRLANLAGMTPSHQPLGAQRRACGLRLIRRRRVAAQQQLAHTKTLGGTEEPADVEGRTDRIRDHRQPQRRRGRRGGGRQVGIQNFHVSDSEARDRALDRHPRAIELAEREARRQQARQTGQARQRALLGQPRAASRALAFARRVIGPDALQGAQPVERLAPQPLLALTADFCFIRHWFTAYAIFIRA